MKYDNLMDSILKLSNLRTAYNKVVSNGGSAGIDGIGVKDLKDHLKVAMPSIIASIRSGMYRPQAVGAGLIISKQPQCMKSLSIWIAGYGVV